MKRVISFCAASILIFPVISVSCTNQDQETEQPAKIENTLQSVSYFKDTFGYDSQLLLKLFTEYNDAIDSIGYPDAGYQLWLIQEDTTDVRFMVEGFWPNQEIYDEIHNHPLYKEVSESEDYNLDGLIWLEYHRFKKIE
jgi:hypothetical protein